MLNTYTASSSFTVSCADGLTGPSVTRSYTATSVISQLDATKKAAVAAQMLAYDALQCALAPVTPPVVYYNLALSGTRNCVNCSGPYGIPVNVAAAAFYSLVSQTVVDNAAAAELSRLEDPANCWHMMYYNDEQSATAFCAAGSSGSPSTHTVPQGTFCSDLSQTEADTMALASAQAQAAAGLLCVFRNSRQTYTAYCSGSSYGAPSVGIVEAGTVWSFVSFSDANSQALATATASAIAGLSCQAYTNTEQVSNNGANPQPNCDQFFNDGSVGPAIDPVTVAAGTYFSDVSQADADAQAQAAATAEYGDRLLCTPDPGAP